MRMGHVGLRVLWHLGLALLFLPVPVLATDGEVALDRQALEQLTAPWTGDLDGIIERRLLRVLVTHSKTGYFLDGPQERGLSYDFYKGFEKRLNETLGNKHLQVHVVFIPVARDQLLPHLSQGLGDVAAANLTVTKERINVVDFTDPVYTGVREIIVAAPSAPAAANLVDLGGKKLFVRRSSSYFESLEQLNADLKRQGKPLVHIEEVDENLETEDILEMVNADLLPLTVADAHLVAFWRQIYTDMQVCEDLVLRESGKIAHAIRKKNPKLKKALNEYIQQNRKGTLLGNMLHKRYLQNTRWVHNANSTEDQKRFRAVAGFLKTYADRYDFDWLMIAALAYQESRLDQSKRSPAGAVGVMQILPSTAASDVVQIPDVDKTEDNIHAGTKYLRWIYDENFRAADMDELNKVLFTFASYNAGFARVAELRRKAAEAGLDPNRWFRNVERIAAKEIGRETVQYVSNIFKYYLAYKQLVQDQPAGG
jgi:membrane-bound lytic murein transglycosylase MltF